MKILPCCLRRRPSLLVFESVKNSFYAVVKFFRLFDEELVKINRKNEIIHVKSRVPLVGLD